MYGFINLEKAYDTEPERLWWVLEKNVRQKYIQGSQRRQATLRRQGDEEWGDKKALARDPNKARRQIPNYLL